MIAVGKSPDSAPGNSPQTMSKPPIDVIYVVASRFDVRFARTCVASIRYFYPDIPIKLIIGTAEIDAALVNELRDYWNVGLSEIPAANWGLGYVKLELLFRPPGERFLVIDSDIVFAGPVLDRLANTTSDFVVDHREVVGISGPSTDSPPPAVNGLRPERLKTPDEVRELYYDWEKVAEFDPAALPPQFVFNGGQWVGTSGILRREDFEPWIDWSNKPPTVKHPGALSYDDQGIFNYVLNQKSQLDGISVEGRDLMWWPPHGLEDFALERVVARQAPPMMLHWAGIKKPSFTAMYGPELLKFFESFYYSRVPNGAWKRSRRRIKYAIEGWPNRALNKARRLIGQSVKRLR